MSYTSILAQINNAPDPTTGLVPWIGTNGEKSILTNINAGLRDKGVLVVDSLASLGSVTGNDAHVVFVLGLGMYSYNANTIPIPAPTGSIVASGGGYWQILTTYGNEYRQTVDTSSGLTFTITHNIGYDYPNVKAVDAGTPHVLIPIEVVSYTDSNTLAVTFDVSFANKSIIVIVSV